MDIIQVLSENIANQIAAGEVIQRPASAVKEMIENSLDSGATNIKLVIKDAGKSLIQVIDNGCGMSEKDSRMSFERHATSKIRNADDLFNWWKCQHGLASTASEWVSFHRNAGQDVQRDGATHSAPDSMSELPMRHMMHAWRDYMTAGKGA